MGIATHDATVKQAADAITATSNSLSDFERAIVSDSTTEHKYGGADSTSIPELWYQPSTDELQYAQACSTADDNRADNNPERRRPQ